MKKIGSLLCLVFALALCATAQTVITFSDMPSVNIPVPVPDGYPTGSYMNWPNFYYVSPLLWSQAGPGFTNGPNARVAFFGGPTCAQAVGCSASIKIPVAPNATAATFTPVSMNVASGWVPNSVVVVAYNQSTFVGSVSWALTTASQTFNFPQGWNNITQLNFFPGPAQGQAGSMVIYTFTVDLSQ